MALYTFLDWRRTKLSRLLESPVVFLVVFFGATFLLVGSDFLLKNSSIENLFMKYSHTSKLLSGRLEMYEIALMYFQKRPLLGYGINCTVVEDVLTFGNAQNGILKLLLDHGILGIGGFITVVFTAFSGKKKKSQKQIVNDNIHSAISPFVALLYGLAICSMVEICLVGHFYLALAVVNTFNHLKAPKWESFKNEIWCEA